jgi:hypothetical protein
MAAATATAVVSLPPRPSVVIAPRGLRPWKPATIGIAPLARLDSSGVRSIVVIFARP